MKKLKIPKAQLSVSVPRLQELLWHKRKFPLLSKYRYSADLMKIYKILIDRPKAWENKVQYELSPEEKLHHVFGTDFRHIYTYKSH